MRALVVFESMYGNTQQIADAIGAGLVVRMDVDVVEVSVAPPNLDDDVGLLVVGAPTHAFGLSRASTRRDAADKASGPLVSQGDGLRDWLETLQAPTGRVAAAAFDTRIGKPRVPGSAARAADRRLRALGFERAAPPESFWVHGVDGPLTDGELVRARRWGEQLAKTLASPSYEEFVPLT
jgi:hypothetical protein